MTDYQHPTRRNRKGANASSRAEALERLKSLRQGGRRSDSSAAFQIKPAAPIYDTVDDDEYQKLVAKRRLESTDFVIDDDGLGYADQGQEEDWSVYCGPHSSDESECGDLDIEKKPKKDKKKREVGLPRKPNPLSAAAAMIGKQSLSNMFTSSVFKRIKDDKMKSNVCSDSIVDDVIAEFAPDEADREMRRKGHLRNYLSKNLGQISPIKGKISHKNCESLVVDLSDNDGCDDNSSVVEEKGNDNDVKNVAVEEKEVKEFVLNAKIEKQVDKDFSATTRWQEVRDVEDGNAMKVKVKAKASGGGGGGDDEKHEFEVDEDGALAFYILDAHEEFYGANAGNVYLFGKVKVGNSYQSCCMVVKNMLRCIYAVPNCSMFQNDTITRLERDVEESKISPTTFRTKLHDMVSGLKTEIANLLLEQNVSGFSMAPVKRNYAFERRDIPIGENYVLKINYPFKDPPLPSDLKGETYNALLGTQCSALELFLIKRKIKGPSWLSVSKFSSCPAPQRVSWCKFEVIVDLPKNIQVSSSSKTTAEIPPVIVTAINLKTVINEKQVNEIVSASVICCHKAKIDTPMLASEWTKPSMIDHFTVVRKPEGDIFPMGFTKEVKERNSKAGANVIGHESSERALLNRLMTELHKFDSDVLVGHNISGFDLDVLLHRAQACRVPSSMWSKLGRLKRSVMPKLTKGSTVFGSGASPGIMSCIAGRLLCDTFLCSRDLLKEVSYSLTQLAKTQLNKDRKEIAPHDIPQMFQHSESLMDLIECAETDAWLSMELMFHLSVLPLTRQLTNISGNLWGKTLQGARAQRVEYLLLHAFHAKKFIVPDKLSYQSKEVKVPKRKLNSGIVENVFPDPDADDPNIENEPLQNEHGKTKKGAAYAGGLVLEPKKGLYDKYILLLDFNSLYPSIIQEYNICFTTVERPADGSFPRLPSSRKTGVLPEVESFFKNGVVYIRKQLDSVLLKNLVERRRMVKSWLKTATGLKAQQFDIQQQALKLTANSMYGCLGFSNSRFYAKPLAELITLQGREILQSTVDLVQNNLNLEVIYGDTDSIMIYSGLDDISKAKEISGKVIQEVNKKYKCLEIDLDGLYKRMLLLKKKKYAAVKLQFKDGKPYEVIERKGLDMVRRDWSLLSKELGDYSLSQILSGGSCEDVVESIHNALMKVAEDMRNGSIALEKYVITKSLTKPPEAYPDVKSQPHVEVALRLKKSGYVTGCSSGDTVPYVICCEQGNSASTSAGIAQRARHPDELKIDNGNWMIDIDYYLAQQIHPVVSRLCASIEGTNPARLADCLGLDSSKFQSKSSEAVNNDSSSLLLFALDDDQRYQSCEPLVLSCPSCSGAFDCPNVFNSICSLVNEKPRDAQTGLSTSNFWRSLCCPKCPEEDDRCKLSPASIANQVKMQAEGFISTYYKSLMMCDDETCKYTTRSLNLRVIGDSERGTVCPNYPSCNGRLARKYTEADLYKQLAYFCYIFDTAHCIDKIEANLRIPVVKELARIRPLVELAASTVQKIRDRCAYGWVQLNDLAVSI